MSSHWHRMYQRMVDQTIVSEHRRHMLAFFSCARRSSSYRLVFGNKTSFKL